MEDLLVCLLIWWLACWIWHTVDLTDFVNKLLIVCCIVELWHVDVEVLAGQKQHLTEKVSKSSSHVS